MKTVNHAPIMMANTCRQLVAGSSTTAVYNPRNDLTKMANVAAALLRIDCGPELFNAFYQLHLGCWFNLLLYIILELVP